MKKIYPAKDCLSERLNYDICSPFYLPSLMGVTKKMLDIYTLKYYYIKQTARH